MFAFLGSVLVVPAQPQPASAGASYAPLFTVTKNFGHKPITLTRPFRARAGVRVTFRYTCRKPPYERQSWGAVMLLVLLRGTETSLDYRKPIDIYSSRPARSQTGSYRYRKPGYYRLVMVLSPYCAYRAQVHG